MNAKAPQYPDPGCQPANPPPPPPPAKMRIYIPMLVMHEMRREGTTQEGLERSLRKTLGKDVSIEIIP